MKKPQIGISDDYASCKFGEYSFYYGYEYAICKECGAMNCKDHEDAEQEWCFIANIRNEKVVIHGSKIGLSMDGIEMSENVLKGIMWLFAKYDLKKKPEFQTNEEWLRDYNNHQPKG